MSTDGEMADSDAMPTWYPIVRNTHDANAGASLPPLLPWELLAEPWGQDGRLLRAARYLGVPPATLADQPLWWVDMALLADDAEQEAREALAKGMQPIEGLAG